MTHILDILNSLAATDSTKEKEKILGQHKGNALLETVFKLAYNKRLTYGITPKGLRFIGSVGPMSLEQFCDELVSKYSTRNLTGNAGFNYMQQMLDSMTSASCEVARRILARDLECGASVALGNKTWPGIIPEQPCFLAESFSLKALAKIIFPAFAQLKADGSRSMAIISVDGEEINIVSRGGNEYIGLVDIKAQLKEIAGALNGKLGDFVVDGELVHNPHRKPVKTPKQHTLDDLFGLEEIIEEPGQESDRNKSNGLGNKSLNGTLTDEEQSEMLFNVWDIVPADVYFGKRKCFMECEDRFNLLKELVGDTGSMKYSNIELIECEEVENYEEALEIYRRNVQRDREGIILKNKHGMWVDARTADQIKFKEEIEIDLLIVDVYPHKKHPNKVGGITVQDASGNIQVNCGSGFKDTTHRKINGKKVEIPLSERHEYDRELLMTQIDQLKGSIAQLKCNGLQTRKGRKPHEPKYKLFLPIFQLIRHDKKVANHIHDVFPDAILD
ncbi:DNA ligase [Aeromonas phage L9-6]|nr:DNA ligase [Aeromonas phage L9-6]